jgi:glycosyltransferase involved in cell wall biosynthesis
MIRKNVRRQRFKEEDKFLPQTSNLQLPGVSIIIPTLNSGKTLKDCLYSIVMQNYPRDKIEIIIADGGSTDETLNIVNATTSLPIRVLLNRLKTGEAGKATGVKDANNEILAFIDSDNILPDKDWLKMMVEPFKDPEIIASEPIEYTYRKNDGYITRYCALLGMNDPLCLFLGNYDRYSTLTGRWTEMPHKGEDRNNYLKIEFDKEHLPTIGANGFLIRRSVLLSAFAPNPKPPTASISFPDYLFDIDVIYDLHNSANSTNSIRFAKVKTGIIHIFSGDIKTFARKQRRRIRDYLYYNKLGVRKYPWKRISKTKLLKFILYCLIVIPLLIQSLRGYIKRLDNAWFFHPIACWLTLWEYGRGKIGEIFGVRELRREGWGQ